MATMPDEVQCSVASGIDEVDRMKVWLLPGTIVGGGSRWGRVQVAVGEGGGDEQGTSAK